MKTKAILFTLLAFWLFTAGSCNDDDDYRLPSITQSGANTAGYKLDGKVILPKGTPPNWTNHTGNKGLQAYYSGYNPYDEEENMLFINIKNYGITGKNNILQMLIHANVVTNEIEIIIVHNATTVYKNVNSKVSFNRIDIENKIFSGTFSATLLNEETNETIEVTDGRFDINLNTLNKN